MCDQRDPFQEQFQRQLRKLNSNPEFRRHDRLRRQMQQNWEARQLPGGVQPLPKRVIVFAVIIYTVVTAITACVALLFLVR